MSRCRLDILINSPAKAFVELLRPLDIGPRDDVDLKARIDHVCLL
ncbi:hypothetical protein [Mesorhizobium sp. M1273]